MGYKPTDVGANRAAVCAQRLSEHCGDALGVDIEVYDSTICGHDDYLLQVGENEGGVCESRFWFVSIARDECYLLTKPGDVSLCAVFGGGDDRGAEPCRAGPDQRHLPRQR